MSTALHIPEWDLADRLRKSLRDAGIGVGQMADRFEVSRNTIGNWLNGRSAPSVNDLRAWADETGVPLPWLRWGVTDPNGPSTSGVTDIGCIADARVVAPRTTLKRVA